jgi:2-oxoglutarate/2-oxoacid ferredoxin oxidoreductase subunit beta
VTESLLADRPLPYCKGCGHGIVAKRLGEALVRLGLDPKDVVLTSDIGCVGLVDPLFPSLHTVHTIHGRSTAIATGTVLADRVLLDGQLKNVVMIGDGGATIGLLHLAQAALMNVDLTVLLHNNMLYGMTGGQHSALTPEGFSTTTTLGGNWLPALDLEQLLGGCHAGLFARKLATDADLSNVIAEAIEYPGFALVEILELCTGFGVPLNALSGKQLRARAEADGKQLGVRIRRADRQPYHALYRQRFPGGAAKPEPVSSEQSFQHRLARPVSVLVAGSAGEHVQSAAALLAQAGLMSGLRCIQKNDYPVTVGTGYSLAEVKLSPEPILFTGIDRADAVLISSGDGLRKARERGELNDGDALLIADATLAAELPAQARSLALRASFGAAGAALGAVAALIAETGWLERAALIAAAALTGGRHADAMKRTLDAGFALGTRGLEQ